MKVLRIGIVLLGFVGACVAQTNGYFLTGAHCSGNAYDDAPAISAAIQAAANNGGGTVLFPPGGNCWIKSSPGGNPIIPVWGNNITIDGNGSTINTTLSGNIPVFGPAYTNTWRKDCIASCVPLLSPAPAGSSNVAISSTAASAFHAGDAVYLQSGKVGAGTPFNCEGNIVTGIATSSGATTLTLAYALTNSYSNDGVNPFGIVDVQRDTRYNLTLRNFDTSQNFGVNIANISQFINSRVDNIHVYTGPNQCIFGWGGDLNLTVSNSTLSVSTPNCPFLQTATGMTHVLFDHDHFVCTGGSQGGFSFDEGSGAIEVRGGSYTGYSTSGGCGWSASVASNVEIHDVTASIDTGPLTTDINMCANPGTGIPHLTMYGNQITLPSKSGITRAAFGGRGLSFLSNSITSFSIISGGDVIRFAGDLSGDRIVGNQFSVADSSPAFNAVGLAPGPESAGFVFVGNQLTGTGNTGSAIHVDSTHVPEAITVSGNSATGFRTGLFQNGSPLRNFSIGSNDFAGAAIPYNPASLNRMSAAPSGTLPPSEAPGGAGK